MADGINPDGWKTELHRRMMLLWIGDAQTHLDHGFDPATLRVSILETHGYYITDTADMPESVIVYVSGDCPGCGQRIRGSLENESYDNYEMVKGFGKLIQALTADNFPGDPADDPP